MSSGSVSDKSVLGYRTLSHLITECKTLNATLTQPYNPFPSVAAPRNGEAASQREISVAVVDDRICVDEWSSSILSRLSQMKSVLTKVQKVADLTPSPPESFKKQTEDLLFFLSAKRTNSARLASTRENAISFLSRAELQRARNVYARRTISLPEALAGLLMRFCADYGLYASDDSQGAATDTRTLSLMTSGELFCLVLDVCLAADAEAGVESVSLMRLAQGDELDIGHANEHLRSVLALKGSHATSVVPSLATVEQGLQMRPFTPRDAAAALFRVLVRLVTQEAVLKRGDATAILAAMSASMKQFTDMSQASDSVGDEWLHAAKQEVQNARQYISENIPAKAGFLRDGQSQDVDHTMLKTFSGEPSLLSGKALFSSLPPGSLLSPLSTALSTSSSPLLTTATFPLLMSAWLQADGPTLVYHCPTLRTHTHTHSAQGNGKDGDGARSTEALSLLSLLAPHVGVHTIVHTGSQPVWKAHARNQDGDTVAQSTMSDADSATDDGNPTTDLDYYPHMILEPPVLASAATISALTHVCSAIPTLTSSASTGTPEASTATTLSTTPSTAPHAAGVTLQWSGVDTSASSGNYLSSLLHPQYRGLHLSAPACALPENTHRKYNVIFTEDLANNDILANPFASVSDISGNLPATLQYLKPSPNFQHYDHSAFCALFSLASSGKFTLSGKDMFSETLPSRRDYSMLAPAVHALRHLHSVPDAGEAHTTPSTMRPVALQPTLSENVFLKYFPTLFGFPIPTCTVTCRGDVKLVERLTTHDVTPLPPSTSSLSSSTSCLPSPTALTSSLSLLRASLLFSALALSLYGGPETTVAAHTLPAHAAADALKAALLYAATLQPAAHGGTCVEATAVDAYGTSNAVACETGREHADVSASDGVRNCISQLHMAHVQTATRVAAHESGDMRADGYECAGAGTGVKNQGAGHDIVNMSSMLEENMGTDVTVGGGMGIDLAADAQDAPQEEDANALWLADPLAAMRSARDGTRASKKRRVGTTPGPALTTTSAATARCALAYHVEVDADAQLMHVAVHHAALHTTQRLHFTISTSATASAQVIVAAHAQYVATHATQRAEELYCTANTTHAGATFVESQTPHTTQRPRMLPNVTALPGVSAPSTADILAATALSLPSPTALTQLACVLHAHGRLPRHMLVAIDPTAVVNSVEAMSSDVLALCRALVPVADATPLAVACTVLHEHVSANAPAPEVRVGVVSSPRVELLTAAVCAVLSGCKSMPFTLAWAVAVWQKLRE